MFYEHRRVCHILPHHPDVRWCGSCGQMGHYPHWDVATLPAVSRGRSTEKSHGWCLERNLPSKSALDSSTVGFQLCLWNKTCLFKSCPVPLVTIWHAFLKWRAMEWAEMGARGYGLCAVFCGTLKTQLYQNRQYHNSQAVNTKSEVSTGNAKKV